ncbi:MAG TPA: hypothetical protein VKD22_01600, partial [Ramlibacter sp.]|nr:hypothetical protein [Ramlibacter sp.]
QHRGASRRRERYMDTKKVWIAWSAHSVGCVNEHRNQSVTLPKRNRRRGYSAEFGTTQCFVRRFPAGVGQPGRSPLFECDEWPERDARPLEEGDAAGGLLALEGTTPKVVA